MLQTIIIKLNPEHLRSSVSKKEITMLALTLTQAKACDYYKTALLK